MEHQWNRFPAAFRNDHNDRALAVLVDRETAINALFFQAGGLHMAAEIAAINLSHLAFTADNAAFHFLSHRFAQFVQEHECGLVGRAQVAAERSKGN